MNVVAVRIVHIDLTDLEIIHDTDPVWHVERVQPRQKALQVPGGKRKVLEP